MVGLGRLGLPMACLLSQKHDVVGYDIDLARIKQLSKGTFVTSEPGCDYSRIHFTDHPDTLIARTELALVCVNTPTDKRGRMDLSQIHSASAILANTLTDVRKSYPHNGSGYSVGICSTVTPGTCEGLELNQHANVFSNPVWIAMGSVIEDLKRPPMVVIGAGRNAPIEVLLDLWASVASFEARQVIITDQTTAEFLKFAHNAWCTTKMSFMSYVKANMPNIDIQQVSDFFRLGGERPGAFWKAGPPFGGQCFPRDLSFWNQYTGCPITQEAENENNRGIARIVNQIPAGAKVLILGRAYKYGVDIEEGSLSTTLSNRLVAKGCHAWVEDTADYMKTVTPDFCIIAHQELRGEAAKLGDCKVIDLW